MLRGTSLLCPPPPTPLAKDLKTEDFFLTTQVASTWKGRQVEAGAEGGRVLTLQLAKGLGPLWGILA